MSDTIDCTTGGEMPEPAPVFGYPLRVALGYVPPGGWKGSEAPARLCEQPALARRFPMSTSPSSAIPGRGYDPTGSVT